MPFFYRIVIFTVYFILFYFFLNFHYCFFIDGAGGHAAALGNETLYGRMLLERSVHMS